MKDMKSVTTRQIQQNTRAVRHRLEAGETLQWTIRGRVVAHMTPAIGPAGSVDWGDPFQRLQALNDSESGEMKASAAEQIYRDRG